MKDIVIRNNKNLSEYEKKEENYYKPVICGVTIIFNAKVTLIEIKMENTWKIQLTITIIFISSKDDNDKEHVMHSKSNNIEIMISDVTDKVIEKLSNSHKDRYQNNLQFKVVLLLCSVIVL